MVFISYSRADYLDGNNNIISESPIAILLKALDEHDIKYWIDIERDNSADQYMAKIAKAIKEAEYILFISSLKSNDADSYWPIKEVSLAAQLKKKIIPIKIDDSEFNEKITLPLAGLDMIEYHKNTTLSIKKLIKVINGYDNVINTTERWKDKLMKIVRISLLVLISICLFLSVFLTIGFCVGYFTNYENVDKALSNAFREQRIIAQNNHIIEYRGETLNFTYDLDADYLWITNREDKLFETFTFQNIMMAASIPLAFDRLLNSVNRGGDKKAKVFILIGGSIGILCGYTFGEQIGENYAKSKNEKAIQEYFKDDLTKQLFRDKIQLFYQ